MSVDIGFEIYGVRDALNELYKIDKKQRFKAVAKIKLAGESLLKEPRSLYPSKQPLGGWGTGGRLGYNPSKVQKGVQIEVGGRTPRGANSYPVVTLRQKDAGGALFDIAGLRNGGSGKDQAQGKAFLKKLNADYGRAQRGLWRARSSVRDKAGEVLTDALNEVAAEVNRKLV